MSRVEATIQSDNYFPFSTVPAGSDQVRREVTTSHPGLVRPTLEHELNLSGSQLVAGCICFLGSTKLLLWAFLKLWLFEP